MNLTPSLLILCGISGSGKSFYANELQKTGTIVVSSDYLRSVIGEDESDQKVSGEVFRTMYYVTEMLLNQRKCVVIDACNKVASDRGKFIKIAKKLKVPVLAYCFNVPLEKCIERINQRYRKVPISVIESQERKLVWPSKSEGFDDIFYINTL